MTKKGLAKADTKANLTSPKSDLGPVAREDGAEARAQLNTKLTNEEGPPSRDSGSSASP